MYSIYVLLINHGVSPHALPFASTRQQTCQSSPYLYLDIGTYKQTLIIACDEAKLCVCKFVATAQSAWIWDQALIGALCNLSMVMARGHSEQGSQKKQKKNNKKNTLIIVYPSLSAYLGCSAPDLRQNLYITTIKMPHIY